MTKLGHILFYAPYFKDPKFCLSLKLFVQKLLYQKLLTKILLAQISGAKKKFAQNLLHTNFCLISIFFSPKNCFQNFLFDLKCFSSKFLELKIFFAQISFWSNIFVAQKSFSLIFFNQNFFGPKNFLDPKFVLTFFYSIFLDQKFFAAKLIRHKNVLTKITTLPQNLFGSEIFDLHLKYFGPKSFPSQHCFFDQKVIEPIFF